MSDAIFLEAAEQLKEAARLGRSFESAQVKIVGLDDIRRAAGDNWSSMSDRVRANSLRFLQGCLGQDDLVIPAGDGFLVIFEQSPGRDFESETTTIRDALNGFYLGDEATRSVSAHVTRSKVDPRGLVRLIGKSHSPDKLLSPDLRRHEFSFVPVWSVKQEAITGYWLAPVYRTQSHRRYGYDLSWEESRVASGDDYLSLDLAIVNRAVQEAERGLASGRRCLLGYSVHSSTLQHRARRSEFLEFLYATPEKLRPYLIGRVAEIEPGTPTTIISEWVHQLRPVSQRVTIQLHESDRTLTGLDGTGAFSASFTLGPMQHDVDGRQAYARHIRRWAEALQRQRLSFRVDNVVDPALLTLALSSGVDFLTSETIWPIVAAPMGVTLFGRSQLSETLSQTGISRSTKS